MTPTTRTGQGAVDERQRPVEAAEPAEREP